MTSNFWMPSDDEWEEDVYSSDESSDKEEDKPTSRFADLDLDSDDEDNKRVTRSAQEKRWDELSKTIKILRNKMLINDWNSVSTEWDNLSKSIAKAEAVFAKDGIPRFLTSFLIELDDQVLTMFNDKNFKKSASPTNAKSLNQMKHTLKKWFAANPTQNERVAEFRANPNLALEEDEKPSTTATSGATQAATQAAAAKTAGTAHHAPAADTNKPKLVGREKWLKRAGDESESSSDEDDDSWLNESDDEESDDEERKHKKKESKKPQKVSKKKQAKETDTDSEAEEGKDKAPEKKPEEWNAEKIDNKIKELLARRGTRNYDRINQIALFQFLIERTKEKANTPDRMLRLLFALVDAQFDVNTNMYAHMNIKIWKSCYNTIAKIFDLLMTQGDQVELVETEPDVTKTPVQVRGLLLAQLERLDEEFVKSLQFMDPHTQDYVIRLRHEIALLKLLRLAYNYYENRDEKTKVAVLAARRLDHLHYRRELEGSSQKAVLRAAQKQMLEDTQEERNAREQKHNEELQQEHDPNADLSASTSSINSLASVQASEVPDEDLNVPANIPDDVNLPELVPYLCQLVYKCPDERLRIKAVLQHIYHLALHDKYFESRDMMLATRMQDEIVNGDISMQILFNRALVQLGLAAFRKGRIVDAHHALAEIMGGRVKELLAQGMSSRMTERTVEQEKLERRRQMPYPMHINIDLLEFVHLTCAMLLEVPNMAANPHDPRKRIISKHFRKTLENAERQTFTGPPENTRDHVVAASKALIECDWELCSSFLMNLDIWKIIPKAEEVKAMLLRKIQEEALRTHLFTNAHFYESIKLEQLVSMFSLPPNVVHSIVSKMMLHEELQASWDQPSASILMNGSHPTKLQHLALQYAEKISVLFDSNDMQDSRQSGGYNRPGQWEADRQQAQRRTQEGSQGQNQSSDRGHNKTGGQDNRNSQSGRKEDQQGRHNKGGQKQRHGQRQGQKKRN